jgi:hypothetical protein
MIMYTIIAFAIMQQTLFLAAFLIFRRRVNTGRAVYYGYIASIQGCGIVGAVLIVRALIGLLYL